MEGKECQKELSKSLCNCLDIIGASEKMRDLHRKTGIQLGLSLTLSNRRKSADSVSFYSFGSVIEGTTTPGLHADSDIMFCLEYISVVTHLDPKQRFSYLIYQDEDTYTGYVKLQYALDGNLVNMENCSLTVTPGQSHVPDLNGKLCLKHIWCIIKNDYKIHGPAVTTMLIEQYVGIVTTLKLRPVPYRFSQWIRRPRRGDWPPSSIIENFQATGCFLVPVGHLKGEFDIEWRLSFSLQERELMFSLNPTQHKCYIILKLIKHDLIEPVTGKCLTSYHCKTCMFYLAERTHISMWMPEKLMNCLLLCLRTLFYWSKRKYCPNYFIPEENMLDRKDIKLKCWIVAKTLENLILEGQHMFFRIKCDHIADLLTAPEKNIKDVYIASLMHEMMLKINNIILFACIQNVVLKEFALKAGENPIMFCSYLFAWLQQLENSPKIAEYTIEDTIETLSFLIEYVRLQLAKTISCLALRAKNETIKRRLIYTGVFHLLKAIELDLTSARLIMATVMYQTQCTSSCSSLLSDLETKLSPNIVSICVCDNYINKIMHMERGNETMPIRTLQKTTVVSCIIFLPCDFELIPLPLRYELYWSPPDHVEKILSYNSWNYVAINGKIYLHVLQFLACSRHGDTSRQQHAVRSIEQVLSNDPNLNHKETVLNALGWLYLQQRLLSESLRCYIASLRLRPCQYAAKWHAALLFHFIANSEMCSVQLYYNA